MATGDTEGECRSTEVPQPGFSLARTVPGYALTESVVASVGPAELLPVVMRVVPHSWTSIPGCDHVRLQRALEWQLFLVSEACGFFRNTVCLGFSLRAYAGRWFSVPAPQLTKVCASGPDAVTGRPGGVDCSKWRAVIKPRTARPTTKYKRLNYHFCRVRRPLILNFPPFYPRFPFQTARARRQTAAHRGVRPQART